MRLTTILPTSLRIQAWKLRLEEEITYQQRPDSLQPQKMQNATLLTSICTSFRLSHRRRYSLPS